jgi:hypothetical protein
MGWWHNKGNNRKVRGLVSCPHLRWSWGETKPKAGLFTKIKVENLVSFKRKSLWSFPPLSLSRVVHLVFLTFMSHCCFVCVMSGRVWPVVQTTTHVHHHAHVWGSLARTPPEQRERRPSVRGRTKQNTTTTEHDKIPLLVQKENLSISKSFSSATCR